MDKTSLHPLQGGIDSCISNVLCEAQNKWAVPEEGTKPRLVSLQRPGVAAGQGSQFRSCECRSVREGVHFQIAPGVLDGIEFRGVGRQEESMQMMKAGDELRGAFGAVGVETVPNQQAGLPQFLVQVAEESNDLVAADVGLGMQAKVKSHAVAARRHGQGGDGRYLLQMSPALDQHRCPAAGLPTAANQRRHEKAAFVEENQPGVQPMGFFLRAGQVCLTQPWMASSSRSTARRAGFCGLQPSAWSKRPRWST